MEKIKLRIAQLANAFDVLEICDMIKLLPSEDRADAVGALLPAVIKLGATGNHEIIQMCLKQVEDLLKKESVIFERFAKELIAREELDYDDIEAIFKEYGKSNPRITEKYIPKTT